METRPYIWGYHHRRLITSCDRACRLSVRELAARCGYENVNGFQRKREKWARGRALRRALVPVAYLDAIAIDWEALGRAVAWDAAEFDAALEAMPLPDTVATMGLPALGVTVREPVPPGLSEAEIYAYAQGFADDPESDWGKALVTWPGMKEVWFFLGKPPKEYVYRPRLNIVDGCVDFGAPTFPPSQ